MKTMILEPGKYYHIYNRARNGDPLFANDESFKFFLRLYRTHIMPVADTYAYCLLKDHLHILLRIREDVNGSIYKPFALLFNAYTKGYNLMNGKDGRLFQFKLKRIEIRRESYMLDMVRYINQNVKKHQITENFSHYRFSSFRATVTLNESMICKDYLIRQFGGRENLIRYLGTEVDEKNVKMFLLED